MLHILAQYVVIKIKPPTSFTQEMKSGLPGKSPVFMLPIHPPSHPPYMDIFRSLYKGSCWQCHKLPLANLFHTAAKGASVYRCLTPTSTDKAVVFDKLVPSVSTTAAAWCMSLHPWKVPLCVGIWCWDHWQRGTTWEVGSENRLTRYTSHGKRYGMLPRIKYDGEAFCPIGDEKVSG